MNRIRVNRNLRVVGAKMSDDNLSLNLQSLRDQGPQDRRDGRGDGGQIAR